MGWWDDFANNLATDLGPLIALFGEAPTKQYLSETTMPEDIVIFAMAPIGILTAVVSAIRVCGSPSLRAFIGRAQEGEGNAEVELCSSTSRNVGELYNNGGIARVFGTPKLLEIIFDPEALKEDFYPNHFKKASAGIHMPRDYFDNLKKESEWTEKGTRRGKDTVEDGTETQHRKDFALNSNLSLNVGIQERPRPWFLVAACLGVTLQCGVLVWAGFSRYTLHFIQSNPTAEYAVPMTATGTILVSFGVGLCAYLVDSTTGERRFKRNGNLTNYQSQMYWIQPGNQKIGDQAFDSFAYTKDKSTSEYITSWKKKKPDGMEKNRVEALVWLAVGSSTVGFILQFLGLRACHSSVSVAQLGAMLVMSIVRAGLRTQRLKDEQNLIGKESDTFKGHELDWLALQLGRDAGSQRKWRIAYVGTDYSQVAAFFGDKNRKSLCIGEEYQLVGFRPTNTKNEEAGLNHFPEGWLKDFQSTREGSPPHDAVKTFLYRCRLARITDHWTQTLVPVRETAAALARAIEGTADFIFAAFDIKDDWDEVYAMYWPIKCEMLDQITKPGDGAMEVFISLKRHVDWTGSISGNWKVDVPELEAVLGLQLLALDEYRRRNPYAEETQSSRENQSMRILWQLPENADFDAQCMEYDMWRESRQPKIRNDEVNPPWSRDKSSLRTESIPMPLRFGWRNICQRDQNPARVRVLALPTNLPLPKLCAQDMYSSFFMAILRIIANVGTYYAPEGLCLKLDFITRTQNIFGESGLGSAEDALICVVPALTLQRIMPTSLHIAVQPQFPGWRVFLDLLDIQANQYPKVRNRGTSSDDRKQHEKVVDHLLRKNVDVDVEDYEGRTPLSYAALEGAPSIVKLLLDNKAKVNAKDKSIGATPLHDALSGDPDLIKRWQNQKAEIVKLLLRNGADPNSTNHEGFTPLHLAATFGRPDIIQELLENGADPSLRSNSGQTPLDSAHEVGDVNAIELLERKLGIRKQVEEESEDDSSSNSSDAGTDAQGVRLPVTSSDNGRQSAHFRPNSTTHEITINIRT